MLSEQYILNASSSSGSIDLNVTRGEVDGVAGEPPALHVAAHEVHPVRGVGHQRVHLHSFMERLYMETQVGLKTTALTLFLNLFFHFLLQLLCVMISHWLTVLKHEMPRQIIFFRAGLVW